MVHLSPAVEYIDCVDFKCSGSSRVEGNVKASEYKVSGSGTIEGSVDSLR